MILKDCPICDSLICCPKFMITILYVTFMIYNVCNCVEATSYLKLISKLQCPDVEVVEMFASLNLSQNESSTARLQ